MHYAHPEVTHAKRGERFDSRSQAPSLAIARLRALALIDHLAWLAPLVGRLAVGLLFVSTGWGKVHDLPKVNHYFDTLGIPQPAFTAGLVGFSELICGALLVLGLFTRFATIPLAITMVVAICTARRGDVHGLFDLVGLDELIYLVVLVMIAITGPGALSLDRALTRLLGWERRASGNSGK
jgi:putative oxidoreductase